MEKSGGTTAQLGCQGGRRGVRTGIGTGIGTRGTKEVVGVQVPSGNTSPLGITLAAICRFIRETERDGRNKGMREGGRKGERW